VKNGVILVPDSQNILAGTTMKRICDVAVRQGFVKEVTSMKITREDLYQAYEVIITASDIHINPVTNIDGKSINYGNIGQVCKGIAAYMQDELSHY
jgi:branched-subunit amino acid aminotransferase/4-amino-4-deoxychorismate lyase